MSEATPPPIPSDGPPPVPEGRPPPRPGPVQDRSRLRRAGQESNAAKKDRTLVYVSAGAGALVLLTIVILIVTSGGEEERGAEPDVTPAVAEFTEAWNTQGGMSQLKRFLSEEARERLWGSMERIFRRRDWIDRRPTLGTRYTLVNSGGGGARVVHRDVDGGNLTVVWRLHGDRWMISSMRFPKRR